MEAPHENDYVILLNSPQELSHGRGMSQRNFGLEWLRESYRNRIINRDGVVFFADDDNTYDIRNGGFNYYEIVEK